MKYKLKLTKESRAEQKGLEKQIQKRITQKLIFYGSSENPKMRRLFFQKNQKPLTGFI